MTIPEGDYCSEGEYMSLNYILECDEKLNDVKIVNKEEFDDSVCSNTIKVKTKYGNKI